jgi:hypothetical protein
MNFLDRRFARVAALLFAVFLSVALVSHVSRGAAAVGDETAAQAALNEADLRLQEAFAAVLVAEDAGGNVTVLVGRLTEAGSVLAGAEAAFAAGNFSGALGLAGVCRDSAQSVEDDAGVLRGEALVAAGSWWVLVGVSVLAGAGFVVVLFVVWRFFRRFYLKRLMGLRPELTE